MSFSVSILLPVINETYSLVQTVESIESTSLSDIEEYLVIVCKKTTAESRNVIRELQSIFPKLKIVEQKLPFLGGAMRDAFELCKGSHVIMMASDLETDPKLVPQLIEESKKQPDIIITGTRWTGGGFEGYNAIKLCMNYVFQKFFSMLYGTELTDMTYGYRIFPVSLVQSIDWEELRHQFLFETVLKPLRLGVKVKEIPTRWTARVEGESQNPFFRNFSYFKTGLALRFRNKSRFLRIGK